MVKPEKLERYLKVIQRLVVLARKMAYEKQAHEKIAAVLDDIEYLPGLLAEKEDCENKFREYISGIADQYGWQGLISMLDDE